MISFFSRPYYRVTKCGPSNLEVNCDPQAAIEKSHHTVYLRQFENAKGFLQSVFP